MSRAEAWAKQRPKGLTGFGILAEVTPDGGVMIQAVKAIGTVALTAKDARALAAWLTDTFMEWSPPVPYTMTDND